MPFTSEAKEAVADYDDSLGEMRLALQECGRKLGAHVRAKAKADNELKRMSIFQRYIPEVAGALGAILSVPKDKVEKVFYETLPKYVNIVLQPDDEGAALGRRARWRCGASSRASRDRTMPPPALPAALPTKGGKGKAARSRRRRPRRARRAPRSSSRSSERVLGAPTRGRIPRHRHDIERIAKPWPPRRKLPRRRRPS